MKLAGKTLGYFGVFAAATFASSAFATKYQASAVPANLTAMSAHVVFDDAFQLTGITSMGSCGTGNGGLVTIRLTKENGGTTDSRLFQLVMTAITLQKPLFVQVDDNDKDNYGDCYADYVRFAD